MPENTMPTAAPVERRVSVGEIAAFVAESHRIVEGARRSVWDRALFFEWKADLFARLTRSNTDESVVAARDEAARLRAELAGQGAA